jgi:outer membrane protein OmpA-like peptidoglycan-associated protein
MKYSIATLLAVSVCMLPAMASAQELSLRAEPGVAVLLNGDTKFNPGGSVALKPELSLGRYLGIGPSASFTELSNPNVGQNNEHMWGVGGFLRVKRPHDNTSTGILAMSPWVDGDLQYVRTDGNDRYGLSAAVGLSVPTSRTREIWMGPFVRYQFVNQENGGIANAGNSNVLVFGFGLELGSNQSKTTAVSHSEPMPVVPTPAPCPPVAVNAEPQMVERDIQISRGGEVVVQFAKNSASLSAEDQILLHNVAATLLHVDAYDHMSVEGYASSEGSASYNMTLSKRRAQAVSDALVASGVPANKLSVVGFGIANPVAENTTKEGREENRRASFTVKFTFTRKVRVPAAPAVAPAHQ